MISGIGSATERRDSPDASEADTAASIHREILQLAALMLAAVAAFFITRAVAASNRQMSVRDAAEWYRRGQQALANGQVEAAIDDLRRAAVRNRGNKDYVLALARALVRHHDDETARGVLMTIRESAPEDAEINLELARIGADRQDVAEATRFYHNALYAPWPAESRDARRRVRFEFIRFLLTRQDSGRALSELLAAAADLPDEPAVHLETAQLFAQAGDHDHALEQFQRVLRLAPGDGRALAGAGLSAFRLGQYALARSMLRRAPADLDDVAAAREIVELVLADDPLAKRIGSAERRRRLIAGLEYAGERLAGCISARPDRWAAADEALAREAAEFADGLKRTAALDQDTLEAGVDLLDRIALPTSNACSPATPRDRALVLIGRQHGGALP